MVKVWFFFFKQKTAYELRISDWSSDVCSSDLKVTAFDFHLLLHEGSGCLLHQLFGETQRRRRLGGEAPGLLLGECHTVLAHGIGQAQLHRSEERRVGKAGVSTCRSRW